MRRERPGWSHSIGSADKNLGIMKPKAPRVNRSCEKTCLVRFPAIWGWSEMSIRLSKIALRASIEEIPKREKLQNREGGFFTASPDVSATQFISLLCVRATRLEPHAPRRAIL